MWRLSSKERFLTTVSLLVRIGRVFFDRFKAQVEAKQDFVSEVVTLSNSNTPESEVVAQVRTIIELPEPRLDTESPATAFYLHYRKLFASEFLNIVQRSGYSRAVAFARQELYGQRPNLRKAP